MMARRMSQFAEGNRVELSWAGIEERGSVEGTVSRYSHVHLL